MADFPLNLPISVQDRGATKQLNAIRASTQGLEKSFTKLSGAFQNAFQFYVRYRIFGLINQGISAIENAIPGLIARGQEWAQTVDAIADATGLAAGRASTLAHIARVMTGDTAGLNRALGALANTTSNHADVLRRYGIETRNANGQMLDSWTVLRNVRGALSDLGNGFLTTAAARELFSRGGQNLIDILTLTDEQFRALERDARRSGVVMTDAALHQAEVWQRTQGRFEQTITGIANVITMGFTPMLTRLVDGISDYIRNNMAQIAGFVGRVLGFITSALAGFLGIDLSKMSFMEELFGQTSKRKEDLEVKLGEGAKRRGAQTRGEDAYTSAVQRQVDMIDRQLAAMGRADRARNAREEQRRLLTEIADAQRELDDLRGKAIFAAGMSGREAELARQQHAADIVEAEKRITDAQRRLQEQNRRVAMENRRFELEQRRAALQEQMAEHQKAMARRAAAEREAMGQVFDGMRTGIGDLPGNVREALREFQREFQEATSKGGPIGRGLREAFDDLIAKLNEIWAELSKNMPSWIDGLNTIAGHLGTAASTLSDIIRWLDEHNPFGTREGQVNLGLSPDTIAVGGAAALLLRKRIMSMLGASVRALLPRVATTSPPPVPPADPIARLRGTGIKGAGFGRTAGAAGLVIMGVETLQNLDKIQPALQHTQGSLQAMQTSMQDGQKSLQDGVNALHDFIFPTTAAAAEREKNMIGAQNATNNNLQSGGLDVAYWTQQFAQDFRTAVFRRGGLLGYLNVNLTMPDGTLIVSTGGIPIAPGNSSTRVNRNQ